MSCGDISVRFDKHWDPFYFCYAIFFRFGDEFIYFLYLFFAFLQCKVNSEEIHILLSIETNFHNIHEFIINTTIMKSSCLHEDINGNYFSFPISSRNSLDQTIHRKVHLLSAQHGFFGNYRPLHTRPFSQGLFLRETLVC